jgi:hypothetical protein
MHCSLVVSQVNQGPTTTLERVVSLTLQTVYNQDCSKSHWWCQCGAIGVLLIAEGDGRQFPMVKIAASQFFF